MYLQLCIFAEMPLHMPSLLSLAILLNHAMGRVHYVAPDDSSSTNGNEATQSLQFYLKNTSKYFSSDFHFYFKMGHHNLNTDLVVYTKCYQCKADWGKPQHHKMYLTRKHYHTQCY